MINNRLIIAGLATVGTIGIYQEANACGVGDVDFQVKADSLNVRAGAGTEYKVIGYLKKGQVVRPFDAVQNGAWGKIKLSNGKVGWVSMQYMKSLDTCITDESSKEEESIDSWDGVVTASILNVRNNPSITSSVINKLLKGTDVTVLYEIRDWYCVEYKVFGRFDIGYVSKDYITIKKLNSKNEITSTENVENTTSEQWYQKTVVTPGYKNLNIRMNPSIDSNIVAKASANSKLEVSEKNGVWVKVRGRDAQGKFFQGWAHSNYIK